MLIPSTAQTKYLSAIVLLIFINELNASGIESVRPEPSGSTERALLLSRIRLDAPELAAIKANIEKGDSNAAFHSLLLHFRSRFPKDTIKTKVINNVARDADEALQLRFRGRSSEKYYQLHRDFEWNRPPADVPDHHWLSLLVSLGVLVFDADMYIKTGDEKYAHGCNNVFKDWLLHCPPGSGAPSWSLATTMMRDAVLLTTFERMVQWPGWPEEDAARMLNAIADHTDIMQKSRGPGNQDATNSEHLMRLAEAFPEFKNAPTWLDAGFERVKDRIFEDVLDDGAQKELCSGYHLNAINSYMNAARLVKSFGREVSPDYMKRLEKMYEWCMVMIRPDGSVPTNGDSNGGSLREYLKQGADLFHRPDMEYIATSGQKGTRPTFTDASLTTAGYYTLRSGWETPDDIYLFMDISRQPVVSHQYYDALHIDLFAYGRAFFPAQGTFTYGGDAHKAAKATANQTTICIDEKNQKDVPAVCHASFTSPELSYLDGSQEGYEGITHRRQVLFVRPAENVQPYFLLIDRVEGSGTHTADQNFYFPVGDVKQLENQSAVQTHFSDGANIIVQNLMSNGLATILIDSEMHPKQGETVKRPGVRFRRADKLPATFVTMIMPFKGSTAPIYSAQLIDSSESIDSITVRIKFGDRTDTLFVARDSIAVEGTTQLTKARAGLVRTSGEKKESILVP